MDVNPLLIFGIVLAIAVLIVIAHTAVVVPQQSAYVVERLGRYHATLSAGFHILIPFLDNIRYRHSLKEAAYDIPAQVCITRDNVQVGVDGILYIKVLNAERASYGISDYIFAISQLAQTMLRSEIGKIDLDKTFEERMNINAAIVAELDKASEAWGVKVLRYEIKNITPPHDVLAAMEKQMRAEREKRAVILTSEGARDATINNAEGEKQQVIKASEARRQQQINEAEGQAAAILAVATRDRRRHPPGRRGHQAAGRHGSHAAARRRAVRHPVRRPRAEDQHRDPAGQRRGRRVDGGDGDEGVQDAVTEDLSTRRARRGTKRRRTRRTNWINLVSTGATLAWKSLGQAVFYRICALRSFVRFVPFVLKDLCERSSSVLLERYRQPLQSLRERVWARPPG